MTAATEPHGVWTCKCGNRHTAAIEVCVCSEVSPFQPTPNLALWRIHPTLAPTDELEDVMRAWREECRRDEYEGDE